MTCAAKEAQSAPLLVGSGGTVSTGTSTTRMLPSSTTKEASANGAGGCTSTENEALESAVSPFDPFMLPQTFVGSESPAAPSGSDKPGDHDDGGFSTGNMNENELPKTAVIDARVAGREKPELKDGVGILPKDEECVNGESTEIKAALRKVDIRLMPFLSICYLASYLDRTNLANARVVGDNAMEKELGLKESEMQLAISIFYLGYIVFEVPSNLMLKRSTPRVWIARIMLTWGIVCCSLGAVRNATALILLRTLLGIFEAGFVPGVVVYLTYWYLPNERSWRIGLFLCASAFSNSLGALIAWAISLMDGTAGLSAWRWIFILEGLPTVICGVICFLFLPNHPKEAKFLNPRESGLIASRLNPPGVKMSESTHSKKIDKGEVIATFKDVKMYLFCLTKFCTITPDLGFVYSFPTIIVQLGFRDKQALLMAAPVYIVSFFTMLVVAHLSDKYQSRSAPTLVACAGAFLGFLGMWVMPTPALKYAASFLVPMSLKGASAPLLAWVTSGSAQASATYLAIASAMAIATGNAGGLFAAYLFPKSHAPDFAMGNAVSMGMVVVCAIATLILRRQLGRLGLPI